MNEIGAPFFVVGDRALQTLGVELIEGRDFDEEDFENAPNDSAPEGIRNVIVTRDLARALFPNGEALNKIIEGKGEPIQERIVGIVRLMHNAWPMESSEEKGHVTLRPGKPGDANTMQYLVRAEPGAVDDLYSQMEGLVLGVNAERTVKIRTLTEIKERTYRSSLMMIELLSAIITVLVIVTLLGIVGLTSFTVTERTRQIGVRRALGATRADILRYFLVESWIVTGIGLVLGGACAFALNYALAQVTDAPKLSPILLLGGSVLLWIAGLLAASVPALRATRVTPDLATRA